MRRLLSRFPTSTLMGLAFTIPAMLIAGLLLFYHSLVAQQFLAEEGARYGDILADQLLSASQRFLRLGSVAAVQEMIEDTGSNRSVVHVALIGNDGRVIGANRRDWIGEEESAIAEPAFPEVAAEARLTFRTQHRLVDGGKRMILVAPLLVQGANPILSGSRGILYIKVDQERKLREIYGAILRRGTVSALGILLVSLFLLLWVREILARPILGVASFLRGFAAGSTEAAPRVAGPREVAQLVEDVGRRVRDLKEKRALLEASEERHRRLLEGAYDAILTVEPESLAILEVNDMFCRLFGYTPKEARRLALHELHPAEERDRLRRIYRDVAAATTSPACGRGGSASWSTSAAGRSPWGPRRSPSGSCATGRNGGASRTSCGRRRRWRAWAPWRAASPTTSTISSPESWATPAWSSTGSNPTTRTASRYRSSSARRSAPPSSPPSC